MNQSLLASLVVSGVSLCPSVAAAHGGTYLGPGDTVPPGAGPGGSAPTTGGPTGPTTGGPTGATTPGPVVPGRTGGPNPGTFPGGVTALSTAGADLTAWSFWWEFNKDDFLDLKAAIAATGPLTGSGDFFLGDGEEDQADDTLRPTEGQIRGEIVPALLAALESETNNDIVTGCLIALAKIGDGVDENGDSLFQTTIAGFLADSSREIAETAALSLGILASDRSVDLLESLARDAQLGRDAVGSTEVAPRVRAFAAYGLGLIGSRTGDAAVARRIASILAELLPVAEELPRPDLAVACVIATGLTPLEAGAPSAPGSGAPLASTRQGQIDALLTFMLDESRHDIPRAHVPTAVARLLDGLDDEACRGRAVEALLRPLDPRAGRKYARQVQQSCALALGRIGDCDDDPADVAIRKALVDDTDELQSQGRKFALIAMAKVASEPGGEAEDTAANRRALTGELVRALRDTGGEDRWATIALGVHGRLLAERSEVTDAAIRSRVRDRLAAAASPEDVGAAAVAAGLMGDVASVETLLELLESTRDPVARGYVALGLGLLGERQAVEPIRAALADARYEPELLRQAATALGLLGSKETVGTLIDMLESAASLSSQAAAAQALGFIGDRDSVAPLVRMLGDDAITATARAFAAVALGIVADKETRSWNSKIGIDLNYRASTSSLNSADGTGVLNIR